MQHQNSIESTIEAFFEDLRNSDSVTSVVCFSTDNNGQLYTLAVGGSPEAIAEAIIQGTDAFIEEIPGFEKAFDEILDDIDSENPFTN